MILPAMGNQSARPALVQWRDTTAMTGHVVDIDSNGLLIAVVHVGDKRCPKDYSQARVLVPQTGVTYSRARRVGLLAERNELPANWQWLMNIWRVALKRDVEIQLTRAALESGSEATSSLLECAVCKQSSRRPTPSDVDVELDLTDSTDSTGDFCLTCALCLLPTHPRCCLSVAQTLDSLALGDLGTSSTSSSSKRSTLDLPLPQAATGLCIPEELSRCLISNF